MNKLKHCPFCGGEAELVTERTFCYVRCMACGAKTISYFIGGLAKNDGYELAIEVWNGRVENGTDRQI